MWKWIAIVVGSIIAVFLSLGVFVPQAKVVSRATINRSPDVVWRVLTDDTRATKWLSDLQSIETISGPPHTVGSRHRLVFLEGNRRMEMIETTTAVDPQKLFAFDSAMEEMTGHTDVKRIATGDSTELVFDGVYGAGSLFSRSMLVLMRPMVESRQNQDMAKFKVLVEAEPAQ